MRGGRTQILLCALLLTLAVALTGCGDTNEANAQATLARTIETFQVNPGTFFLDSNLAPTVVVGDQFTQYTLTDNTSIIRFNLSTGEIFNGVLFVDEVVIERPLAGTVTIIHGRR
jgi:hypothetical protein